MNPLDTLAAQAVVGSDRQAPSWPDAPGAVGELLRQLAEGQPDPAPTLLRMAGVLAICGMAGYSPPEDTDPPPALCPPNTLRNLDTPPLLSALSRSLADGPERLQAEALRLLSLAGAALPFSLLPIALELGHRSRALRPTLLPTLDQRGLWLAQQNPDWHYAVGLAEDTALWDTGTAEQRASHLRQLRATDPAQGRDRYTQALPELSAKERAALLAEFATGLSLDDEPLLETALKDRAKDVRQTAMNLLIQLPDSRYAGRMGQRLAACLRQERKLFKTAFAIDAPENFVAEWKADGLEDTKPKHDTLGPRAWWLYQLVRATPLSWWETQTGWTPTELLNWAAHSEWREALWRGWLEAAQATAAVVWITALMAGKPPKGVPYDISALLGHLPPHAREPYWLDLMEREGRSTGLAQICAALPLDAEPVSIGFAQAVIARLQDYMTRPDSTWDYRLREALPQFACLVPPALFAECQVAAWPSGAHAEAITRFQALIELRATLHHHLSEPSS